MAEFRSPIALAIWGGLSLVMFAAAAGLTWRVTAIHGAVPFQPKSVIFPEHYQTIEIYDRPGSIPAGKTITASYDGIDGEATAGLNLYFPEKSEVKVFVNNLVSPTACSSPRSADQVFDEDKGINVSSVLVSDDKNEGQLYFVTPSLSDANFYVHCEVRSVTEALTYSRRETSFSSITVFDSFPDHQKNLPPEGFEPLPAFLLRLSLSGSENVGFSSGFEDQNVSNYERARIMLKGSVVTVQWDNIYSGQMRDIILIVIGSLIAIGVTMLIEAVRPFVDRIGQPRHKASSGQPE
jgi:hypothetical protein